MIGIILKKGRKHCEEENPRYQNFLLFPKCFLKPRLVGCIGV